ncbi:MAG TPA: phosphoribosyltransferase family protein [Terriglobales bacterium]|nr:phosphoribosyltransferase family protein [Terriglobales bacterium]
MSAETKGRAVDVHPTEVKGPWDRGYILDKHTLSSTMIGYNEFGHPEFDTQRSQLGEMVYRLKYKSDKSVLPSIIETICEFVRKCGLEVDLIVPVPASKSRLLQPVVEIAEGLGKTLGVTIDATSLKKVKRTSQMKDIGDFSERVDALQGAFTVSEGLRGKRILLIDDLFQSGATMNVVARVLKEQGCLTVNAIALTRTRS